MKKIKYSKTTYSNMGQAIPSQDNNSHSKLSNKLKNQHNLKMKN